MSTTTKAKFNKQESTLWLLTACLGLGMGVGAQFVKGASVSTVAQSISQTSQTSNVSKVVASSPNISVFRQPVFRSVGRTRGS